MRTMASEWVKLTLQDGGKTIHVNLANVSSIECDEKGSVIWFLAGVGEDGVICMARSAYAAQNSVALSHNHSSVSRTGQGRSGARGGGGSANLGHTSGKALGLRSR